MVSYRFQLSIISIYIYIYIKTEQYFRTILLNVVSHSCQSLVWQRLSKYSRHKITLAEAINANHLSLKYTNISEKQKMKGCFNDNTPNDHLHCFMAPNKTAVGPQKTLSTTFLLPDSVLASLVVGVGMMYKRYKIKSSSFQVFSGSSGFLQKRSIRSILSLM